MAEGLEGSKGAGKHLGRYPGFVMIFGGMLFGMGSILFLFPQGYEYFYGIPGFVPALFSTLPAIIAGIYLLRTDDRKVPVWVFSVIVVLFSLTIFNILLTVFVSLNYVMHITYGYLLYSHEEVLAYSLIPIVPVFEIALIMWYFLPPSSTIDVSGLCYPVSRFEEASGREARRVSGKDVRHYYLLYSKVDRPRSDAVDDSYRLSGLGFILMGGERIHYIDFYGESEIRALVGNMRKTPGYGWKKKFADTPLMSPEDWRQYELEKKTAGRQQVRNMLLFMLPTFALLGGMMLLLLMMESAEGIAENAYVFIFLILVSLFPIVFFVGNNRYLEIVLNTWVDTYLLATYLRLEKETSRTLMPVLDIPRETKRYLGIDDSARSPLG